MNQKIIQLLEATPYEGVAFSLLDFSTGKFSTWENTDKPYFFDLASLTKPLTMSFLNQTTSLLSSPQAQLLMNHRGGFKAHEILTEGWQEKLLAQPIKESPTLYSDLGVIRLCLECEGVENILKSFYEEHCFYWKEAKGATHSFSRRGEGPNDDNVFFMDQFSFHAGLYARIQGLSELLLKWNKEYQLLSYMKDQMKSSGHRFVAGWDRVQDPQNTLAGEGASLETFGFLGFIGTSLWIDITQLKGYILLTNAAYQRAGHQQDLNILRREIGKLVWKA